MSLDVLEVLAVCTWLGSYRATPTPFFCPAESNQEEDVSVSNYFEIIEARDGELTYTHQVGNLQWDQTLMPHNGVSNVLS